MLYEGELLMKMACVGLLAIWAVSSAAVERPHDGNLWPDDHGVHINAHGGGVIWHEGRYYWYGEHKVGGIAGNVAHGSAVHCYSSTNLVDWTDEGAALLAEKGEGHDLEEGCVVDRGIDEMTGFGADLTWGCQSTCIFPVHGRPNSFVAMFDRWCPENAIDGRYVWREVEFSDDGRMTIPWKEEK